MKKDTRRPNGTIKRIQKSYAPRKGVSSMGSSYVKGDSIVHFSSSRSTGETFVLTEKDLEKLVKAKTGRWWSPVQWGRQLHRIWVEKSGYLCVCPEHADDTRQKIQKNNIPPLTLFYKDN